MGTGPDGGAGGVSLGPASFLTAPPLTRPPRVTARSFGFRALFLVFMAHLPGCDHDCT